MLSTKPDPVCHALIEAPMRWLCPRNADLTTQRVILVVLSLLVLLPFFDLDVGERRLNLF